VTFPSRVMLSGRYQAACWLRPHTRGRPLLIQQLTAVRSRVFHSLPLSADEAPAHQSDQPGVWLLPTIKPSLSASPNPLASEIDIVVAPKSGESRLEKEALFCV